jgi:uncharacterized protein YjiK
MVFGMIGKTFNLIIVLAALLAACTLTCNGIPVDNGVPEAVQLKVRSLYPDATEIEWDKVKDDYSAVFLTNGKAVSLLLDSEGNILEMRKEIDHAQLPSSISEQLEKKRFKRVPRIVYVKEGKSETYRIVGLTEKERYRMSFDAGGKLLSETVSERNRKQAVKAIPPGGLAEYKSKWDLPSILHEISGIALIDDHRMACVQDETGSIFIFDLARSEIVSEIPFGEPGDYEGIALVNEDAWVLRSDGMLYEVQNFLSSNPVKHEHWLLFPNEQNLEGLCYDKANNRLLIAPREYDTESIMYKGIYAFDLASKKLSHEPLFRIMMDDPLLSEVDPRPGRAPLMPSAIGIHPVTGKIYITDARNSQVLVTGANGVPEKLIRLSSSVHPKAEGITFSPSGDVYLSNEGKRQTPNIVLLLNGAMK